MAALYPNLQDRFKSESICPICMMEIASTPKYTCDNNHTICHRCKPYYYSCPTCRSQLHEEAPADVEGYHMPPAIHYMPHPYPPYPVNPEASAPFLEQERHKWAPPSPTEDQELHPCQYSRLGCYAQIPEHLRFIHESRCQFRPNLENEQLPTDLYADEGAQEACKYSIVGCNVKLASWRRLAHEELCIYKDKYDELGEIHEQLDALNFQEDEDPEELVECRFYNRGCTVRMPRRRKHTHEAKCNHADHEDDYVVVSYEDPDEQLPCCWSEFGCQVRPRRCKKESHEEKCNYKRQPCCYADNGCCEYVEAARKFAHERTCEYA